jgi:hypothetical protein
VNVWHSFAPAEADRPTGVARGDMNAPSPDSGLKDTDIALLALAGNAGDYNPMLTEAATARIDLPAASTTEIITAILEALARIEADGRWR